VRNKYTKNNYNKTTNYLKLTNTKTNLNTKTHTRRPQNYTLYLCGNGFFGTDTNKLKSLFETF